MQVKPSCHNKLCVPVCMNVCTCVSVHESMFVYVHLCVHMLV